MMWKVVASRKSKSYNR